MTGSPDWPTRQPLGETAATTIGFFSPGPRAFFAAHGISRMVRVITDNGSNYRAHDFHRTATSLASRPQRTRPYTPRHNGKVKRYQRILAEELLSARPWTSEAEHVQAIAVWNILVTFGRRPPAAV